MKKLSLILLMLVAISSFAQETFNVTGTLFDENKDPLPDATLRIVDTDFYTITDIEGVYYFDLVPGEYTIEIMYIGYQSIRKTIKLDYHIKNLDFNLVPSSELLDEALVSAVRVDSESPVTHSNMSKKEIAKRNLGQDIPIIMNYMPSVVTTSDAGAGIGYTGIRVRGSDATRVNVTINGIPYNDSESMGTFWVNMPDFSSSVENLQLQRGVGTSTNGAGAFGASLNLLTDAVSEKAYADVSLSTGSYNTFRSNVKFSTGRINDHIEFAGRLSTIKSDGYVDRASSDLKSYFLQGSYVDDNTLIKALVFGGQEETFQAWYGVTAEDLENDRTKNYYTYDNEVDHYNQDHYQLHWNQTYNENWSSNIALHYTYGRGYYEQFKEDEDFADYGFDPIMIGGETIDETDIIRRKWLDNDFFGTTFSFKYQNNDDFNLTVGGAWNKYDGDHFGEVIWAEYASQTDIRHRYYDDYAIKTDFNLFAKANYTLNEKLNLFGDLQIRNINYEANGVSADIVDDNFNFFNPKAGVTYTASEESSMYFSYARANREPNRTDYENGNPKPEKLNDFELGWRWKKESFKINTNLYYMRYQDQLVLTGELDDVGAPIRANVGDSYRLGLEIDANFVLSDKFSIVPNLAISSNKNIDFTTKWDGEVSNLGNTNISFSPNVIVGNMLNYSPVQNLQLSLLSKYVGEQYMGNVDTENSKLDAYFTNDLNVNYVIATNKIFKSIVLSALVNNIFNEEYVSNGYYYTYDDTWSVPGETTTLDGAGYYPQATINFLLGATFNF
ncbi:TonB-dependent receptor [Urechidicola vernalis]|uniref:TonB-dependent receptor n=1 Tax=Urechidicola vernalis TaxID=3075600 RepID=A0ABU2Y418_9FLAO|nr:TonB-dependent receptor [Urechidicola sp. P050]MDT0552948.1 TonB-dependent receptor [Urechidicola sp. P050]